MSIHTIEDLASSGPSDLREALRQVSIQQDLATHLKWLYEEGSTPAQGAYSLGWHPRGLGLHPSQIAKVGVCKYKLYLDCTGEIAPNRTFDAEKQLIFDTGHMMHNYLQTLMADMYEEQFQAEVRIRSKKLLIVGSADGLLTFPSLRAVVEIKTIKEGGNYGFAKVQDKPFIDNVRQMTTYMKVLNVPFGNVIYLCKNNGQIKEHPMVFNPTVWEELKKENITPIVQAVAEQKPPVASPGYHCTSCDYFHACPFGKEHRNARRQSQNAVRQPDHPVFRRELRQRAK